MSTVFDRPGTRTEETLATVQPTVGPASTAAAFVGESHRGPTTFTRITSWNRFQKLFGRLRPDSVLGFAVYTYFNNGGRIAWVARVLGDNSVTASRTLLASDDSDALEVSAHNPGAWGNDIYVQVSDGSDADLFTLTVYHGGTGGSNVVERWVDVSMDAASSRFVEAILADGSTFISAAVDPDFTGRPVNGAAAALADGADGDAPVGSDKVDALEQLDTISEVSLLNVPGETSSASDIVAYATGREDLWVVLDPPQGASASDVVNYAESISPGSSYGGIYAPWVRVSDPTTEARGATRLVPPGGTVVGQIAAVDRDRGVFKTPAGLDTVLNGVTALERAWTAEELGTLNLAHVNALVAKPALGPVIYGGRTLRKTLQVDRYINARRTMIYLKRALSELFEFAVFENNDGILWDRIRNSGDTFLTEFWQQGGLVGDNAEQAFFVRCDEETNPEANVAQGILTIETGVALQRPAEFVVIRLSQTQGRSTTSEIL